MKSFLALSLPLFAIQIMAQSSDDVSKKTEAATTNSPRHPPYINSVTPYPPENTPPRPTGAQLLHSKFCSETLGDDWGYIVYLPPGYDTRASKPYPLILWLHGTGGSETSAMMLNPISYFWKAMEAGKIPQTVLVAPWGLNDTYWHDEASCVVPGLEGKRFDMTTALVRDLLPHLEKTYNIRRDRAGRAITGFSMGGYGATTVALSSGAFITSVSLDGSLWQIGAESEGLRRSSGNDPERVSRYSILNILARNEANARATRFYISWSTIAPIGNAEFVARIAALGATHKADDLRSVIDVHHAYRFLVPETGGDNVMAFLKAGFENPPSE